MFTNGLAAPVAAALVAGAGIVGCATPGTRPHDMSVGGHEAAAAQSEVEAAKHASSYDPSATKAELKCAGRSPCWTSVVNPTADELRRAERYQALAAKHRAAAQELRDAEARACVGISEADRDLSPFSHHEDIAAVGPIYIPSKTGRNLPSNLRGALVSFRAVPGLTAEWLQHSVNCHLARNAALGHPLQEMPDCPLVPKDVTAKVSSPGDRFEVEIRAGDSATAGEVWRRARQLGPAQE